MVCLAPEMRGEVECLAPAKMGGMVCSTSKLIKKVMRLEGGKLYGRNRVREEEKGCKEARN